MMKTKAIFLWTLAMILFWTSARASPIGYSPTENQISQQDDSLSKPSFHFDPKSWLDVDIWISPGSDDNFTGGLFDSSVENKGTRVSVTAYLFSYGAYLHEWELPFFETWAQQGIVAERPFEYRGHFPVPGYATGPLSGKFEYPYAQLLPKMNQGPSPDTFTQKYAPPEEQARFAYPHAQMASKAAAGPAAPAPSGLRYSSPGAGYQEGGPQAGGPGAGESYQYGAPTPESGYPYGQSQMEQRAEERRLMQEQLGQGKGGIGEFRQQVAVSRAVGKPYGMILLGAGLVALAALFRMFRLSLFIMVGWLIIYGRDIWRIIVDLV